LVGCGNMAGAMVEGWRAAGIDLAPVTAIRPSGTPVEGVRTVTALPVGENPVFVMLGFKPQKLDEIDPGLAPRLGPATILVSLLAGVEAATLRHRFPTVRAIVRAMPNLPVAQRRGVIVLYTGDFVEALAAGGQGIGLAPDLAAQVALETLIGTAAMATATGLPMSELARRVASPKGTTEAGLAILDESDGLKPLIARMLAAAIARGRDLAAAARG